MRETYLYIGTTAELIKLVPVIKELHARHILFTIIASGQNDIHFEEYADAVGNVPIVHAITPKGKNSSLFLFFLWAMRAFVSLAIGMHGRFRRLTKKNSYFIVHGDTVSSLIGSLVAKMYGLTLVHVESGLRSYNFFEPFPEEICRFIISRLADLHFCPNAWAVNNLAGHAGVVVNTKQNTLVEMYEKVKKNVSNHPLLLSLLGKRLPYMVLVAHRQENVLFRKKKTARMITYILHSIPRSMRIVFLAHDVSADFIYELGKAVPQDIADRIIRVERLPYADFIQLMDHARFIITDGGSNQEELSYMGKPTLILRNRSERIEGLGKNIVLAKNDIHTIRRFMARYQSLTQKPFIVRVHPSKIIVDTLIAYE